MKLTHLISAFSLILLAAFLIWWLSGEYNREAERLRDQASTVLRQWVVDITDKHVEEVVVSMQTGVMFSDESKTDELKIEYNIDEKDSKSFQKVKVRRTWQNDSILQSTIHGPSDNSDSITAKIMFNSSPTREVSISIDSIDEHDFLAKIFIDNDSLTMALRERLETWISPGHYSLLKGEPKQGTFSMLSDPVPYRLADETYSLGISGYRVEILKKIASQISISFLLFGLVAAAIALISRSLRQQVELLQLRSELISNITHELKTPITTVGVALEALENFSSDAPESQKQEYITIGRQENNRLAILVDRALNLAQYESGQLQLQYQSVDLCQLIDRTLPALELSIEEAGAKLTVELPIEPTIIRGDELHLQNVIYNLLDNALKYSKAPAQIVLELKTVQNEIILKVSDSGIGIPRSEHDKIFEKFYRLGSRDDHKIKGHGLGLTYVKSIVLEHGGRIEVDSILGEGSCFSLFFQKKAEIHV